MKACRVLNGWPTSVPARKVRMGFWSFWGLVFTRVETVCLCERVVEETVSNEILDMCVDSSAFANTYMRDMFAALSQEAVFFFFF